MCYGVSRKRTPTCFVRVVSLCDSHIVLRNERGGDCGKTSVVIQERERERVFVQA